MDYQRIYDDIMNIDSKIRLVTICDLGGKITHSGHRQGVTNLLTPEEKIKRITIPLGEDHILYITTEVEADDRWIIDRVKRVRS